MQGWMKAGEGLEVGLAVLAGLGVLLAAGLAARQGRPTADAAALPDELPVYGRLTGLLRHLGIRMEPAFTLSRGGIRIRGRQLLPWSAVAGWEIGNVPFSYRGMSAYTAFCLILQIRSDHVLPAPSAVQQLRLKLCDIQMDVPGRQLQVDLEGRSISRSRLERYVRQYAPATARPSRRTRRAGAF